jgi:hypothetical protein
VLVTLEAVKWIIPGVALAVSVLAVPTAGAQNYVPFWTPDTVDVAESSGTIELTITKAGPGHVRYWTGDGRCEAGGPSFPQHAPDDCEPGAQAPRDYGAVSGDLVYAEAGSKKVQVPIVNDNLDETREAFTVYAYEGTDRPINWTGTTGIVWIIDDDGDAHDGAGDDGAATPATTTVHRTASLQSSTASAAASTRPPQPSELTAELASDDLQPGPGIELVIGTSGDSSPEVKGKGEASFPRKALALTTIGGAVATCGVVWARRGRWSSAS